MSNAKLIFLTISTAFLFSGCAVSQKEVDHTASAKIATASDAMSAQKNRLKQEGRVTRMKSNYLGSSPIDLPFAAVPQPLVISLLPSKAKDASVKNTPLLVSGEIPVAPTSPKFQIEKGQSIHRILEIWAKRAGWTLIWYPSVSWLAVSDVEATDKGDVVSAISEIISVLREEGKPVRLRVSDGNKVMEVLSTEVKND